MTPRLKPKVIVPKGFWGEKKVSEKNAGFKSFADELRKQRFVHNESKPKEAHSRAIIYNEYIKEIIKSVPGLLTRFSKFSNSNERRFVDPKGRFEIINVIDQLENRGGLAHNVIKKQYSNKAQIIIINDSTKKIFFVKENNRLNKENTLGETLAQNILKKYGIQTIGSHSAYHSVDWINLKLKSFVIYDFSNLLTLEDAYKNKMISEEDYSKLHSKIYKGVEKINKLHLDLADLIYPHHYFFNPKTKEIYLFDPFVINFDKLYEVAKKELNLRIK